MDAERLFYELLRSPDEAAVEAALKRVRLWDDSSAWRDLGDLENNFSTIGNQQANPEAALVEKLINSVDAVLTLKCWEAGTAPDGPHAPADIRTGARTLLGIPDGDLAGCTDKELTELARNIGLIATGARNAPNLTVFDRGEGQEPGAFPTTLMSINRSNKLRIPFVQGKFNMGGTGVLQFCGRQNFQLVASRRSPSLNPGSPNWGFTLVRRDDPKDGRRSSVFRYLAPQDGVLEFSADRLVLGRLDSGRDEPLPDLTFGTVIKLFAYSLPPAARTNILFDLRNHLAALMPSPALPVRVYERRAGFRGHSLEANIEGLATRLNRDTRDNLEFPPTTHTLPIGAQELRASVFAFKRKETRGGQEQSGSEKFRTSEGIIFAINGQAHGHYEKAFFRRKAVDMAFLADDLLVLVDATGIDGRAREDLFMNSRDRIRSGDLSRRIERELEGLIRGHELLRELRTRRKAELVASKLSDDRQLEEVLQTIIKKSPSLSALFITGTRLSDPYRAREASEDRLTFLGRRFPTFFRLMRGQERGSAEVGRRFRVQFETDANNDYFTRPVEPATYVLTVNGSPAARPAINALNGIVTWNIPVPPGAAPGDVLAYNLEVTDPSRSAAFSAAFTRTVQAATGSSDSRQGKRKPPTDEGPGSRQLPSGLALPEVIGVRQDDWNEHKFDRESALKVVADSEGTVFFVNLDNVYLANDLRRRSESRALAEAKFKYGMTLFGLALLKGDEDREDTDSTDIHEEILRYSRAFAPILLPMIDGLSELDESFDDEEADEDSIDVA